MIKIEKYMDYLVDGIKAYVDSKINKANFDKTENGQIVAINSNSTYNVKVGKNIYTNVKTLGGTCELNEIVKVVSPQNQPSNMFISKSGGSGESYALPIASESTLGGIKVGNNLIINANGILSVNESSFESYLNNLTFNDLDTTNKLLVPAINEVFQSVSDGKQLVASAITDKGVPTEEDATFQVMANNIKDINNITPSNITTNNSKYSNSISYLTTSYSQEKISP